MTMDITPYMIRGGEVVRVPASLSSENGMTVGRAGRMALRYIDDGLTANQAQTWLFVQHGILAVVWPDPASGNFVVARRAEIVPASGPERDAAIVGAHDVIGDVAFFQDEEAIPATPAPNAMAEAVFDAIRAQEQVRKNERFISIATKLFPAQSEQSVRDALDNAGFNSLAAVIQGKSEGLL